MSLVFGCYAHCSLVFKAWLRTMSIACLTVFPSIVLFQTLFRIPDTIQFLPILFLFSRVNLPCYIRVVLWRDTFHNSSTISPLCDTAWLDDFVSVRERERERGERESQSVVSIQWRSLKTFRYTFTTSTKNALDYPNNPYSSICNLSLVSVALEEALCK